MLRAASGVLAILALATLGCGGAFTSAPPGFNGNLLENPGFEAGEAGWTYPVESPHWG